MRYDQTDRQSSNTQYSCVRYDPSSHAISEDLLNGRDASKTKCVDISSVFHPLTAIDRVRQFIADKLRPDPDLSSYKDEGDALLKKVREQGDKLPVDSDGQKILPKQNPEIGQKALDDMIAAMKIASEIQWLPPPKLYEMKASEVAGNAAAGSGARRQFLNFDNPYSGE